MYIYINMEKVKICSDCEPAKDTPYFAHTGELWDNFEFFWEKTLWDIKSPL